MLDSHAIFWVRLPHDYLGFLADFTKDAADSLHRQPAAATINSMRMSLNCSIPDRSQLLPWDRIVTITA